MHLRIALTICLCLLDSLICTQNILAADEAGASQTLGDRLMTRHWVSEERPKSPNGSPALVFSVMGTFQGDATGSGIPLLLVAWTDYHWQAILYPANEDMPERASSITFRWDDAPAEIAKWSTSSDHKKAFSPSPKEFVVRLLRTNKLRVRVEAVDQKGATGFNFDVSGLKAEMAKYPDALKALEQ